MNLSDKLSFRGLIVVLCFGIVPAVICQFLQKKPTVRNFHITSFRYGKSPSVIRCNRGDTLHLTFSTNDTGHSFFLQEFDIDVKVSPGNENIAIFKASDPTMEPVLAREVILVARHPGMLNYIVSRSNYRCHVWCGPMHAFEQGKLIILPNTLLVFSLGILAGILFLWLTGFNGTVPTVQNSANQKPVYHELFLKNKWIIKLVTSRWTQMILVLVGLLMIYTVILTTMFGTKVSGRNLGVLLMWAVWLFILVAILTPLGGRIWCAICPLPFFGDFIQRRSFFFPHKGKTKQYNSKFYGFFLKWPAWLSNEWPRIFLFMVMATVSIWMVAVPRASGIAIILLLVLATFMAVIWELRAFCRYLCPVSVFVNPYSRMGILSLRNKSQAVCDKCRPKYCQTGSPEGWACPYGINVGELTENTDCGLCLECTRSCLYGNVSLYTRPFASELKTKTTGEAWLTLVIFSISIVYSAVYLGHWTILRDCVNVIDKNNWHLFGIYTLTVWIFSLIILPGIFYLLSIAGKKWSGASTGKKEVFLASAGSLLPLGLSVWICFVTAMLFVNVTFIKQSLSDPFGWGWDFFGTANSAWHQFIPEYIPWIQSVFILTGYFLSLRNLKRTWVTEFSERKRIFRMSLPIAVLLTILAVILILFFTN